MENNVIERKQDQVASQNNPQESDFRYTPPPTQPEENNVKLTDFLNPRSMLSPGVAGSLVMLVANTLWVQFMVPQKWSALALSFLLIIPVLIRFSATIFENVIYFIFNGLIVFALAVNTNFVGAKIQEITMSGEQASLDTQKINTALKNSLMVASTSTDQKINKINHIQLANNDDSTIANLGLAANNRKNGKTDFSKQTEKKSEEKHNNEKNKKDRNFFGKWF